MKILHGWLKELLPLDLSAEELARKLLLLGFEVEGIQHAGPAFSGVVVGEVLAAEKHPNADRLRLCRVSDGSAEFSVVCGAPNVAAGQKIAFAKLGAKLPGGLEIRRAKIRGVESEGMICSASELGQENGKSEGILVLSPDSKPGADYARTLGGSDAVLDVSVTPNRPDCLSHLGLARELAVYFDLPFRPLPADPVSEASLPEVPVDVQEPAACPRYLGRTFSGLTIGPSPAWLAARLQAVGLRPINNLVDITNYILMETGQPLHAFDLDKLEGGRLSVRFAKAGEKIKALDGREYSLTPENLVIADAKRPTAVAGVIGGEESGITDKTARAFLECAYFAPARVRRSAKLLGLKTDSSYRFERGADPAAPSWAAQRASALILKLCGGQAGKLADHGAPPKERPPIQASPERINRILGSDYPPKKIEAKLRALSSRCESSGDTLLISPPSWRHDLENVWDLAEEAARHLGYDSIPYEAGPVRLSEQETPLQVETEGRVRRVLSRLGFYESYNYDFVSGKELERFGLDPKSPEFARVLNPVSEDWEFLRPNLLVGLLRNAQTNSSRQISSVRIFEIGRAYGCANGRIAESNHVSGLSYEKIYQHPRGFIEPLLRGYSFRWQTPKDPRKYPWSAVCNEAVSPDGTVLGAAAILDSKLARRWDLRGDSPSIFTLNLGALLDLPYSPARFDPFSQFPSTWRDISIAVNEQALYIELENCVRGAAGPDLARLELIDTFAGKGVPEGKKSLTLRLTFSRMDRTLRDEEVAAAVDAVVKKLEKEAGAKLRG